MDASSRAQTFMRQSVIAVVDDDPDVRQAIATLLSAFNFSTQQFASAEEFLDAAKTSSANVSDSRY